MLEKIKNYISEARGVIHIGAHHAEEKEFYDSNGISPIIWIEANPEYRELLQQKLSPADKLIISGVGSRSERKKFNLANNGHSSSFLDMGKTSEFHPDVFYTGSLEIDVKRMDDIIAENEIDISRFNFLNLDVQGFELEVLRGFGNLLCHIDFILTEINEDILYKECALLPQLDEYLQGYGFSRVETHITPWKWGDGFYIRNKNTEVHENPIFRREEIEAEISEIELKIGKLIFSIHQNEMDKQVMNEDLSKMLNYLSELNDDLSRINNL
jgi:FkbM family methyltransferase